MMAAFILAFALVALIRFGVSEWRTIWITAASRPLSDSLQLRTGLDAAKIGAEDFGALMNLCDQLSPGLKKASPWLNEVSAYYRAVAALQHALHGKLPAIAEWTKCEMRTCSRYVAVVLDQSLAMSLDRQLANRTN
jgi:hypothetical protein